MANLYGNKPKAATGLNFVPPTAQDVYGGNNQNLFGQFGMDPKGDNEVGAWARRNAQLAGYDFSNRLGFRANEFTPFALQTARGAMNRASPGNIQARTGLLQGAAMDQASELGNQSARDLIDRGYSPAAAEAVRLAARNRGQRESNNLLAGEYDRMFDEQLQAAQLADYLGQADPSLLLGLGQFIEGRSQANKADRAQGGFGGAIGQLIGLGSQFLPMPGMGGAGGRMAGAGLYGGGSNASSGNYGQGQAGYFDPRWRPLY